MAAAGGSRGARKSMQLSPRGGGDRTVFLFDRRREQADPDEKVLSYGKNSYRGFRSAVCQVQGGGGGGVTERIVTRRPARGRDGCERSSRRRRYRHGEGRGGSPCRGSARNPPARSARRRAERRPCRWVAAAAAATARQRPRAGNRGAAAPSAAAGGGVARSAVQGGGGGGRHLLPSRSSACLAAFGPLSLCETAARSAFRLRLGGDLCPRVEFGVPAAASARFLASFSSL